MDSLREMLTTDTARKEICLVGSLIQMAKGEPKEFPKGSEKAVNQAALQSKDA
jgi:hypothetical protein